MYKLILLILLSPSLLLAQDYTVTQATFLKADAAQVFDADVGVSIQVEGLKSDKEYKAVLTLNDQTITKLVVWKLMTINGQTVAVFPPTTQSPVAPGVFHIAGNPGDSFGTDISNQWIKITIGPTPAPDPDPDPDPPSGGPTVEDIEGLAKIVKNTATLNDPITAKYIKAALHSLSEVSEVKAAIGEALIASMKEVRPPYKDWEGVFRKPVDAYLVQMKERLTKPEYLKIMIKVIVDNLGESTQSITSKIVMYSNATCTICTQWKERVYPALRKAGWILEEVDSAGVVPRYIICDRDRCSEEFVGYMTLDNFNKTLAKLRGT
jgi:hypothetical protein